MKSTVLVLTILSLIVLASCAKQEVTSQQSIQDIIGNSNTNVANKTPVKVADSIKPNLTNVSTSTPINSSVPINPIIETAPIVSKKCRDSTIVYGGCKWKTSANTTFNLNIGSASRITIHGVWFAISGESGATKYVKHPEDILAGGIRVYPVDYPPLVKEIGRVTRLEVLPIETLNGTEVACFNMHVYTIPDTYCKPAEAAKID